ncbi:MAG: hypothetical protein CML68_06445 [Rhodobacteraceae bacterium]|nr:hypothetical protein [Paracoccaceae bacterium]
MAEIIYVTTLGSDLEATGAVTDLDILWTDTGPVLYATCQVTGTVSAYDVSGGTPAQVDSQALPGDINQLGGLDVTLVEFGDTTQMVTLAGSTTGLPAYALGTDGAINGQTDHDASGLAGPVWASASITLATGTYFFAATEAAGRLGTYQTHADGSMTLVQNPVPPTGKPADIAAMVTVMDGAAGYLVLASATQDVLQCYRVNNDGSLRQEDSIGVADGLGINSPAVMATVTLDGQPFVIAGAAGSSSLSVVSIDEGRMTATDHVVDSLDTRFQGASALAATVVDGRAFVVAAGGDDGLTLMSLLPTGRLVVLDTIADTLEMGLDAVDCLALAGQNGVLDIFVGSGTEGGVTQLSYALGTAVTLVGTAGNDVLTGGAGDDILVGGQGADQLRGGDGADVFVFDMGDGALDKVMDFQAGTDTLDLSGWTMLRSADQIGFTVLSNGIQLTYAEETLQVFSADGTSLSEADIRAAMTPGSLIHTPVTSTTAEGLVLTGTDGNDTLQGGAGDDFLQGLGGGDALIGGAGIDTAVYSESTGQLVVDLNKPEDNKGVAIGDTYDSIENLIGSDGRDIFKGNTEDNFISGGNNKDSLIGRKGDDRLDGGADDDKLEGGLGADTLIGGEGNDRVMYKRAVDPLIADLANPERNTGEAAGDVYVDMEEMVGGRSDDFIFGDDASNKLWGREGNDEVYGRGGNDTIYGSHGEDWLDGGAGNDILTGGGHHDAFAFGAGHDQITDFRPGIETIHLDAEALWAGTLSTSQVVSQFATVTETGVLLSFSAGASLLIEGMTTTDGLAGDLYFL